MSADCLFCKIVKGDISSSIVYEDKNVIAFLDIFPFTKGHTVVIPVEHYDTFFEFPDDKMEKYFSAVRNLANTIKTRLNADGINIVQNNFIAAGQKIFHMHYHIIPRWEDDMNPFIRQPKEQATPEYLAEMVKAIRG